MKAYFTENETSSKVKLKSNSFQQIHPHTYMTKQSAGTNLNWVNIPWLQNTARGQTNSIFF